MSFEDEIYEIKVIIKPYVYGGVQLDPRLTLKDCLERVENLKGVAIDKQRVRDIVNGGFGLNANQLRKYILKELGL